jgi:hypothetical protein
MARRRHETLGLALHAAGAAVVTLHDVGVHGLVREVDEERLPARLLDEAQHLLGQQVGHVTLLDRARAVDVERGVDGLALARHADPVVESRTRAVVVPHVPLAKEAGAVACTLQRQRKHGQTMAGPRRVVDDAVRVRVLAGQQARAAGRAQRRGGECIGEARTLAREAVDGRCLDERMPAHPEIVPTHVVDQDHDHVGNARRRRCRRMAGNCQQREQHHATQRQ